MTLAHSPQLSELCNFLSNEYRSLFHQLECKPVHVMKVYNRSRCAAPLILNLDMEVGDSLDTPAPLCPVPIKQEAGWAPELIRTFRKRKKPFSPTRNPTPVRPVQNLDAILNMLNLLTSSASVKHIRSSLPICMNASPKKYCR